MADYAEVLSGTNDDVNTYISEHPEEREAVLAAEREGQARKGILEGPHNPAPKDDLDGDGTPATTKGQTFAQAAEAFQESSEQGYLGTSPEAERVGRRDKGLSQRNPAIMEGGPIPDPSPHVDDSEAISALRSDG